MNIKTRAKWSYIDETDFSNFSSIHLRLFVDRLEYVQYYVYTRNGEQTMSNMSKPVWFVFISPKKLLKKRFLTNTILFCYFFSPIPIISFSLKKSKNRKEQRQKTQKKVATALKLTYFNRLN